MSVDRLAKEFAKVLKEAKKKETKAYDTTAQVVRVEGDTVWVHIPSGIDETPVRKTINAQEGDWVQVRVAGGRAWLTGNQSAPPTDDRVANYARSVAAVANDTAVNAEEIAQEALRKAGSGSNQYFWHKVSGDDAGSHITQVPQEDFETVPVGGNARITSDGLEVRDGLENLAEFKKDGATVGKGDARHITIKDGSFVMTDDEQKRLMNIDQISIEGFGTIERITDIMIPYDVWQKEGDPDDPYFYDKEADKLKLTYLPNDTITVHIALDYWDDNDDEVTEVKELAFTPNKKETKVATFSNATCTINRYFLTSDTKWNDDKDNVNWYGYFKKVGDKYENVEYNPSANPKANGWYELYPDSKKCEVTVAYDGVQTFQLNINSWGNEMGNGNVMGLGSSYIRYLADSSVFPRVLIGEGLSSNDIARPYYALGKYNELPNAVPLLKNDGLAYAAYTYLEAYSGGYRFTPVLEANAQYMEYAPAELHNNELVRIKIQGNSGAEYHEVGFTGRGALSSSVFTVSYADEHSLVVKLDQDFDLDKENYSTVTLEDGFSFESAYGFTPEVIVIETIDFDYVSYSGKFFAIGGGENNSNRLDAYRIIDSGSYDTRTLEHTIRGNLDVDPYTYGIDKEDEEGGWIGSKLPAISDRAMLSYGTIYKIADFFDEWIDITAPSYGALDMMIDHLIGTSSIPWARLIATNTTNRTDVRTWRYLKSDFSGASVTHTIGDNNYFEEDTNGFKVKKNGVYLLMFTAHCNAGTSDFRMATRFFNYTQRLAVGITKYEASSTSWGGLTNVAIGDFSEGDIIVPQVFKENTSTTQTYRYSSAQYDMISLDGVLGAGGGGGGSNVSYTPTLTDGTEIGKLTIDGSTQSLFAPYDKEAGSGIKDYDEYDFGYSKTNELTFQKLNGMVTVRIADVLSGVAKGFNNIGTLPVGWRPKYTMEETIFGATATTTTFRLIVKPDGTVQLYNYGNATTDTVNAHGTMTYPVVS